MCEWPCMSQSLVGYSLSYSAWYTLARAAQHVYVTSLLTWQHKCNRQGEWFISSDYGPYCYAMWRGREISDRKQSPTWPQSPISYLVHSWVLHDWLTIFSCLLQAKSTICRPFRRMQTASLVWIPPPQETVHCKYFPRLKNRLREINEYVKPYIYLHPKQKMTRLYSALLPDRYFQFPLNNIIPRTA